jgi:MFS family permease
MTSKLSEWKANWRTVMAAMTGVSTIVLHIYSFGTFLGPLSAQTGWTKAEISSGFTILSVVSVFAAPVVGVLTDRLGARAMALPGLAIYASGLAAMSVAMHSIWMWWLVWAWIAVGFSMAGTYVWSKSVALLFDKSRGLALAVTLCGGGLTMLAAPLVAEIFMKFFGLSHAYVLMSALWVAISLPLGLLFIPKASAQADRAGAAVAIGGNRRSSVWLVFRSRAFYLLMISGGIVNSSIVSLTVHFVPLLHERGIDGYLAAGIAGSIGVTSIVGRLIAGMLMDRFDGSFIAGIIFALPIVTCVLLAAAPPLAWVALVAALVIGLAFGAEFDILAYLVSRHFGVRQFTTIFGFMFAGFSIFSGVGPPLVGWLADKTGSYHWVLVLLIPFFALAGMLVKASGKYPARS